MTMMAENKNTKLKRSHWHDYHEPCIYLVTVTTVDREPLLGQVEGDDVKVRIKLSTIGKAVWREIEKIPERYPQVKVMQHQIMPDHVHLVLRVTERLPEMLPLGNVVAAWKAACSKAAALCDHDNGLTTDGSSREATFRSPDPHTPIRPLFVKGYNDSILTGQGQLRHMMAYVRDNPRRLYIKRQHGSLFAIRRDIMVSGMRFDAVGNLALLQRPLKAVHCRRRWTEDEQRAYTEACLTASGNGTVLIGAFISKAEQAIARSVRERHLPLIHLVENGFNDLYKPVGEAFYATAEGRLLQLAPWPYHNDSHPITRQQCTDLNNMAERIANTQRE